MQTIIVSLIAVVLLVAYLMRRRSRLRAEDNF